MIIGALTIVAVLIFTVTDKKDLKELPPIDITENLEETVNIIEPIDTTKAEEEKYVDKLRLAYEGRMDRTKAIIGEYAGQYLDEPEFISYFLGGLAIKYDDILVLTNGYFDEKDDPVYGDIVMIVKDEAYGIKMNMSMEEVENLLGQPGEIIDFSLKKEEDELFGNNLITSYDIGDYEVIIEFNPSTKAANKVILSGQKNNLGYPTAEISYIDFLTLSSEELNVYNNYKEAYDEEILKALEPLAVMKLYIHAGMEKDYETEWELYTKEEKQLGWDKEYHMNNIPDKDRGRSFDVFEKPINIRIDSDEDYAYISWEDKYLEEYDGFGTPFRFCFSLVKSKDGIWKVAFTPMQ